MNDGIDFQPSNSSSDGIDFQPLSLMDKAKDVMHTVSQGIDQVKQNPAFSTSPVGLLNSGMDLARKGAQKAGDFASNQMQHPELPEFKASPIDPITSKVIGTGMALAPDIATLGIPTGATEGAAEGLENIAGKKALQSLELPDIGAMAPAERETLSGFVQDQGLVGRNKEDVLEHARDLSKKFGGKIGEIGDKASGLGADRNIIQENIQGLIDKANKYKGYANKEAQTLARDYQDGAQDIFSKVFDDPSWNNIQDMKEQYGKLAFDSHGEVKSEGAKDTYFALKNMLKSIAENAQDSNLAPEYKEALSGYSKMQPIEESLEKAVSSEYKGGAGMGVRGMIGLIKRLPGPVRAFAGPALAVAGHPYLGAAAALPELTNPALQSQAASGIAKVLPAGEQALRDFIERKMGKK